MTITEIRAFASTVGMDERYKGKRVVVRAPLDKGGKYLSMRGRFDADRGDAVVYDYDKDKVGEQVRQCVLSGMPIEVEEV